MKIVVKRVTKMSRVPFPNEQFFDFSSIEKQISEIKKRMAEKGQIIDVSENTVDGKNQEETMEEKEETIEDILKNQLSILQDIQYLLSELEKNTRKKKRSFLFGKNDQNE